MARYRVDISEPAENDLRDIVRYISAQLSAPMTAIKMMDTMNEAIAGLALMPQKCTFLTDERLAMLGYRKLPLKNYIVFTCIIDTKYKLDEKMAKSDVHQIISYMEAKKCSVGILLYPSNRNTVKPYPINSKTVYQVRIDLCGEIENAGLFLLDVLADILKGS